MKPNSTQDAAPKPKGGPWKLNSNLKGDPNPKPNLNFHLNRKGVSQLRVRVLTLSCLVSWFLVILRLFVDMLLYSCSG